MWQPAWGLSDENRWSQVRKRYVAASLALPVAVGAIIAAYGIRQHGGQQRTPVAAYTTRSNSSRMHVVAAQPPIMLDQHIQTAAQATARALEVAQQYGAASPHVIAVEQLPLADALTRTPRVDEDEIDLGAAGYGESTRMQPTWRVQLGNADFGVGSTAMSVAALSTAVLVLAAASGTLIDLTLGYPDHVPTVA